MATKKKMLQAAAGNAGGAGPDVEDVFSTYLYTGTGSAQTINNGIDLAGEGGIVWTKMRYPSGDHTLMDSGLGTGTRLLPNENLALLTGEGCSTSFNSNGITLGSDSTVSNNTRDFASWTFRKAPKFFDVVTYTGNGVAGRTISHDLGTTVGMLVVKSTSHATDWKVLHRSVGATIAMELNNTRAATDVDDAFWDDTPPTDTHFTVGSNSGVNLSGRTYVAYLFAHNDGDGEFGGEADADIIKCGSFSGYGTTVNLGWEPQWLLVKRSDSTGEWVLVDNMRGIATGGQDAVLYAHASDAETSANDWIDLTSTGFTNLLGSGTYIYMAIRRGTKVPESGTEVFEPVQGVASGAGNPAFVSTFTTDAAIFLYPNGGTSYPKISSRLTGATFLETHSTGTEAASDFTKWDFQTGAGNGGELTSDWNGLLWKRAPGYFDVVAYTGNGTAGRTVSHNLTVAPEMMWIKNRDSAVDWLVYHKDVGAGYYGVLSGSNVFDPNNNAWNSTAPTSTDFTLGIFSNVNGSGSNYIAYLFASLPGISKVGSYTGNGSSQTIDCGFTSGARYVLIKRTDSSGDWNIYDTARGIVAGNDSRLSLNTTDAEDTSNDRVDSNSSGFTVNYIATGTSDSNISGASYIFYATA